jgi:hypothetical protein
MRRHRSDATYITLFLVVLVIGLLAVLDPFETVSPSRRALGGLVLGPFSIWYAIRGWRKGVFPELSKSSRHESSFQFWFCFIVFASAGTTLIIIGLRASLGN